MRTPEMWKLMEKNRQAKVKRLLSGTVFGLTEYGSFAPVDGSYSTTYNIGIDEEWELVREPVDFMTAIKAYANGKRIRVVWSSDERIYGTKDKAYPILDNKGEGISVEEILDGKWFIE